MVPTPWRGQTRTRLTHAVWMPEDPDESPIEFFHARGLEVRIGEHDLHAEHVARGEPGRASFYAEGQSYFCVDLLRDDGSLFMSDFACGETVEAALDAAQRRYRR